MSQGALLNDQCSIRDSVRALSPEELRTERRRLSELLIASEEVDARAIIVGKDSMTDLGTVLRSLLLDRIEAIDREMKLLKRAAEFLRLETGAVSS